jgi:C-type mannose receptor
VQNEGCEPTWVSYSDSCYRILQHRGSVPATSWEDARAYCQVLGGDLASIGTQEEGRFLQRQLSSYGTTAFWLGLYRNSSGEIANEGWVWMDGTALKYKKWGWSEPNNFNKIERCGEIYANTGYWNDASCSESRSSICERKKGKYWRFILDELFDYAIVVMSRD